MIRQMILVTLAAVLVSCTFFSPTRTGPEEQIPDMVLVNGRIHTMDGQKPRATAIAIKGDRIFAVGESDEIAPMARSTTRVIDLRGKTLVPGLIESHAHLFGMGRAKMILDLTAASSEKEIAALVRARADAIGPGPWIEGRGWDQNVWDEKRFPSYHSISEAAPGNPVCLTRVDGHAVWVNRAALDACDISAETVDPEGGRIERDSSGAPTGVLVDNAADLVGAKIPPLSRGDKKKALLAAIEECNAHGFTGFHDAGAGEETISLYREILAEGRLTLRLNVMLSGRDEDLVDEYFSAGPVPDEGGRLLAIRSVKLFADGALGSRGAALLEDYADEPGNRGLLIESAERIFEIADRALAAGFQVCTHAIGDRGNRICLDAYERAFRAHPEVDDPRFRIEHAQILDRADIARFAELGVIAAMQAQHCTSDMAWVPDRIGAARSAEGAYVWKSLLDRGVVVPNGSDAPVESANPFYGLYAAITRRDRAGRPAGGWYPEQCMTRQQALESFTLSGAYASFEEELKVSLEEGKLADMTILSKDIMSVPAEEILETEALLTIVGGRIVFERDGAF